MLERLMSVNFKGRLMVVSVKDDEDGSGVNIAASRRVDAGLSPSELPG